MTLRELEERLSLAGIEEARREAAILAEHFCGIPQSRQPFMRDAELGSERIADALCRRISGEPLQYIIGVWDFMNETYEVTPDVLIPRQDTETLVEWAIKNAPEGGRVADLCTGSGCVAVSALARRRDLTCVAVDKYPEAIALAKRNAERNGVADRIEFRVCDVLTDVCPGEPFDAVLSNPPYVTAKEYADLQKEVCHEPEHALTDGADGLTFYRRILEVYPARLAPGGTIALEIGSSQAKDVCAIAEKRGMKTSIIKDYSGHDRVAVCEKEEDA